MVTYALALGAIKYRSQKLMTTMLPFFTYDVSAYNGPDVYAPVNDNPLQAWDKYAYGAFGERVIDMSVTRVYVSLFNRIGNSGLHAK